MAAIGSAVSGGTVRYRFNADASQFARETKLATGATRQLGQGVNRARQHAQRANREFAKTRTQFAAIGAFATGFGGLGGAGLFALGFGAGARGFLDFNRELTKVNTLVGVSREQLNLWKDDIIDISRETGISTAELSQGLFNIVSIGQEGEEAMESLRVIARATAVGLGDFATVADTITRIMSANAAANLKAEAAADIMFATIKKGNDEGANFVKVFQEVVKRSELAGESTQDFAASLAFLTTEGFTANRAGLGLNETFKILFRQTKIIKKELADIGLSEDQFKQIFRQNGLIDGLEILQNILEEYDKGIQEIFITSEASSVTSAILGNLEKARQFQRELNVESVGASQRGFLGVSESAAQQVRVAVNEVGLVLQQIAEKWLPAVAARLDALIPIAGAFVTAISVIPVFGLARGFLTVGRAIGANTSLYKSQINLLKEQRSQQSQITKAINESGKATAAQRQFQETITNAANATEAAILRINTGAAEVFGKIILGGTTAYAVWSNLNEAFAKSQGDLERIIELQDDLAEATARLERAESVNLPVAGFIDPEDTDEIAIAREEVRKLTSEINNVKEFGAEVGALITQYEELEAQLAFIAGQGIDIFDMQIDSVRDLRLEMSGLDKEINNLIAPPGDFPESNSPFVVMRKSLVEAKAAAEDMEEAIRNVDRPLRDFQTTRFIREIQRSLEDVRLTLNLSGADPADIETQREFLRFRRKVEDRINALNKEEIKARREIGKLEGSEVKGAAERLLSQQYLLDSILAEKAEMSDLLDANTELGGKVREIITGRAEVNRQIREGQAAEEAAAGALERRLRMENEYAQIRRESADQADNLIRGAEAEIRIAELRNSLAGEDQAVIAAEIAILQAKIGLEEEEARILKDIRQVKDEIARADRLANEEAAQAARDRLGILLAELEALETREEVLERYGVLQRRLAKLGEVGKEEATEFQEAMENIRRNINGAVEDIFFGAASIRDGVKSIINEVIKEFTRLLVIRPLLNLIFGAFGGGAGVSSSLIGTSDFQGFQRGGQASGLAVVGEAGPELVDFRRPGRVYSNDDLAAALDGGGGGIIVNQSWTINSTDGPGVRRELAKVLPVFEQITINNVARQMSDKSSVVRQSFRG